MITDRQAKIFGNILVILIIVAISWLIIGCGTTKAVVRSTSDNVTSEIRITTNNSNTVIFSPKVIIDSLKKN